MAIGSADLRMALMRCRVARVMACRVMRCLRQLSSGVVGRSACIDYCKDYACGGIMQLPAQICAQLAEPLSWSVCRLAVRDCYAVIDTCMPANDSCIMGIVC